MHSFSVVYYFYYFYFFMRSVHGFGNRANLCLAALNGGVYTVLVWWGGRCAQRWGYYEALKLGLATMALAMGAGLVVRSAAGHILVMVVAVAGMCFTWPSLEALASEGEKRAGLPHMVGVYNVVWASTAAIASFTGGAILEGLGWRSLFYVPGAILAAELGLAYWLAARARAALGPETAAGSSLAPCPGKDEDRDWVTPERERAAKDAGAFRNMAWLANPCAYLALNTVIAVLPGVARRLELSTMLAGFYCSVWCFARFGAFVTLWLWTGWHYRFGWLLGAYLALVASFATILTVASLPVVLIAQLAFGWALGLMYYSSLFYSMDNSDAHGEHGGLHEAAIGFGNFAGPAAGAASLCFLPESPASSALAVSFLLVVGLVGLCALRFRGGQKATNPGD